MTTDFSDFYVDAYAADPGEQYTGSVHVVHRHDSLSGKGSLVLFRDTGKHCLVWHSDAPVDPGFHRGATLEITGTVRTHKIYKGVHQTTLRSVEVVPTVRAPRTTPVREKRSTGEIVEDSWRTLMTSEAVDMRHAANILGTTTGPLFAALRAAGVLERTPDGHRPVDRHSDLFRVVRVETEGGDFDKTQVRPFAMPLVARAWVEHGR